MSQEPPRVNFPGSDFPNRNPASAQSYGRRPNGNAGRVVAIVLGILFSLVFLCAGGMFVTYRRFNADSNFGGKFEELREPIGGALPDKTRGVIQRGVAVESDETKAIANWLEIGYPNIDKSRMVMEMQRSGLSNAAVNPLTRTIWQLNLGDVLEPPDLGDRVVVLDFEWLVQDKEARAVVAGFTSYTDESCVQVLYLTHQDDQWKLFDWRDVLLPLSEAQYWAVYAGLDTPQDDAYVDFNDALYEILTSTANKSEKVKLTMAKYHGMKFPRRYAAMAQDSLCTALVRYKAKEELAEISKQLSPNDFAGAWLYKAQSAAWSNENELAFQYLSELNKQVGWHPRAGRLAAEIAVTAEHRGVASDWLEREILLAPINSSSLESYFKVADRSKVVELFQRIAKSDQAGVNAIELLELINFPNEKQIQYLAEIVEPVAELQELKQYLDLKLAVRKEDFEQVLNLAPKVLKSVSDSANSDSYGRLWGDYLDAAVRTKSLTRAFEETPDRDKLLYQLRDLATYNDVHVPPKEAVDILKSVPDEHELQEDIQTQIAIGKLDDKQGNVSEAFDLLRTIYKENEGQMLGEEFSPFTCPLLTTLGSAALKSERWQELKDVIDPEVLVLSLAWSDAINADQLNEVFEWFDGLGNQPAYWSKYFHARAAFHNGDWPAADQLIVEAIRLAKQDPRVTDEELPPIVGMLLDSYGPDGYDVYDSDFVTFLVGLRMSYATRCNALVRLVSEAQVAGELDENWVERIREHYSMTSIESQEKLASLLKATPIDKASELAAEIVAGLSESRGQHTKALENQVNKARGMERGSFEHRYAVMQAGTQLIKSGDPRMVDSLRDVSRGTEVEAYVDCVVATLERDIPKLSTALERWKEVEWNYQDFVDVDVLKRLEGLPNLHDLSVAHPIDMDTIPTPGEECSIVLSADPESALQSLEEFAKGKGLTYKSIEASHFDQAKGALEFQTSKGDFVITISPISDEAFVHTALIDSFAKEARSIALCVPQNAGLGSSDTKRITVRTLINVLMDGMPSAIALHNPESASLFCGAGWQQRFSQALQTGIDLAHPQECYELLEPKMERKFIERDGQGFVVVGVARELVPVKLEPQSSPWLEERGVTQAHSIMVPCLPADIVLKVER